ncbi:MAG: hypothetical protein Kow0068_02470 [Marinilabiliales bacterium]
MLLQSAFAQTFVETRTIKKAFPVNKTTTFDVTNKYGKIQFLNWDYDSIKIIVEINISSDDYMKLEKLKQNIDVDIIASKSFITAVTNINTDNNKLVSDVINLANPKNSTKNMVTIDYTVYIPKYINLNVINKYGDIYLDDLEGTLNLEILHGDLKANSIEKANKINIKFGKANINNIEKAWMSMYYADAIVARANHLNFDSKSSDIVINEVNTLKVNSRRDKFNISKINSLYGISSFTDFFIDNFYNEINIDLKYGSMNIDNVSKNFVLVKIFSKYTDVVLMFEHSTKYSLDMHYKNADFSYPQSLAKLETKLDPNDDKAYYIDGFIGGTDGKSMIKLDVQNCNVKFLHKN